LVPAAAASAFLSDKLSCETRRLLTRASDKIKTSKLNTMIDEFVEQNVEQARILDTRDKILEAIGVRKQQY
jgi:hypothetical protein